MKITELQINNFGKLYQKQIAPMPGLNVVYGSNESGKTTLHQFICGMMFGMEKQRGKSGRNDSYQQYEPWNSSSYYSGAMRFQVEGRHFWIERNFYRKEKTAVLRNERDGEELSVAHGDMEMLLGGMKKSTYENTYCIRQASIETGKEFAGILQNYFVNASHTGDGNINLIGARKNLKAKQKEFEGISRKIQEERKYNSEKLQPALELAYRDLKQLNRQLEQLEQEQREEVWEKPVEDKSPQMKVLQQRAKRQKVHFARIRNLSLAAGFLAVAAAGIRIAGLWGPKAARIPAAEILVLLAGIAGALYFRHRENQAEQDSRQYQEEEERSRELYAKRRVQESTGKQAAVQVLLSQRQEKYAQIANLSEEIEEAEKKSEREQEAERQTAACELALRMLEQVSGNVYEDTREQLEREVSGILASLTGGKYDRILLDEELNLTVYQEGRKLSPWQLSRGTMEQLYLALRLGARRFFTEEEKLPILLDEALASFDDRRLEHTLEWLAKQPEQIFLFTCQKREMEILEQNGIPYGKILLESI